MKRIDIVDELCAAIEQDRRTLTQIAQAAHVHQITLKLWLSGATANPRVDSLDRVARVLGLRLAWAEGNWTLAPIAALAAPAKARTPRMALWRFR
jgi:DNA-binding phage protein